LGKSFEKFILLYFSMGLAIYYITIIITAHNQIFEKRRSGSNVNSFKGYHHRVEHQTTEN
jgi:hypothetical protein